MQSQSAIKGRQFGMCAGLADKTSLLWSINLNGVPLLHSGKTLQFMRDIEADTETAVEDRASLYIYLLSTRV